MSATETATVVLEPATQAFAEATANPPYLFDLGPDKGRETVDQVQSGQIDKPDADVEDRTVPDATARRQWRQTLLDFAPMMALPRNVEDVHISVDI